MEVVVALDEYEDIFDDFDIRPYAVRNISADFLHEVVSRFKKAVSPTALVLTVPRYKRVKREEKKIVARLKAFFRERSVFYKKKKESLFKQAVFFILVGLISSYLGYAFYANGDDIQFFAEFFFVATYFFIWNGFSNMFFSSRRIAERQRIFESLADAEIVFKDEDVVEKSFNKRRNYGKSQN